MEEKDDAVSPEEKKGLNSVVLVAIGIIIGLIIMVVLNVFGITFNKNAIGNVNGKSITEASLFNKMKEFYGLNFLLEEVDKNILDEKYELDKEQTEEVKEQADYYLSMYESYYDYTEEEFLKENGFASYDDFISYLSLDYKRNLYVKEYAKTKISDENIKDYYENNVYGDIDSKHILVKVSDEVTEEQALALAKEIIVKLDKGATFDEMKEEYKDKITYEELGYQGFNSGLEESYTEALKVLENGKYTEEPVKTSYGYHIIFRIDQKEKESLDKLKENIQEILIESSVTQDSSLSYKALIKMREEAKFTINDNIIKEKYDEYIKQFEETELEETVEDDVSDTVVIDENEVIQE